MDHVRPIKGVHFREYNICLIGNTNVNSYKVDVEESAIAHRDREVAAAVNPIPDDHAARKIVS